MGHQIIKQPDGKLAVFSDNVNAWILYDGTPDEIVRYYEERAAKSARESAQDTVDKVLAGHPGRVYFQFAMTFEEADAGAEVPMAKLRADAEALETKAGRWTGTPCPARADGPPGPGASAARASGPSAG